MLPPEVRCAETGATDDLDAPVGGGATCGSRCDGGGKGGNGGDPAAGTDAGSGDDAPDSGLSDPTEGGRYGPDREIEAGLLIRSERPRAVAGRIAGLERIGPFDLGPLRTLRIRDRYLDIPEGELRTRGLALRVRETEGEVLLALKGDARPLPGGGLDRLELEAPASAGALATILEAISERGIELPGPPPAATGGDPTAALEEGGWEVIQDRETRRRRREVLGRTGGDPEADLVVDSVLFRGGGTAARHHEVEIEAAGPGAAGVVREVRDRLLASFPETLAPWDHAKLATGIAVRRLLESADADGLVGPRGDLLPGAYELLRARLEGEEPGPQG